MTIKEIAKLANVSLGTVDRVIHNRGKVSKKTKEKVLEILERVNYQPNMFARGLVLNKTYSICALIPSYNEGEYWEMPARGLKKAEENLKQFGINLEIFYFDQNSVQSFIKHSNKIISLKPDGVILAPVINFEAVKWSLQLKRLQIPFSVIDSKISNSGALGFIGQDAFQSGKLAAKLLCSEINGQGVISIISIKSNENHNKKLQLRTEGFKEYIYNSDFIDNISLVEFDIHQGSLDWKNTLKNACSPNGDTVGIFVPSSKVYYAADCIVENFAEMKKIKLVGYDLVKNTVSHLKSGVISYVIGQRPESQGYAALDVFYKHLVNRQTVKSEKYLPLDIITRENLMYYNAKIDTNE